MRNDWLAAPALHATMRSHCSFSLFPGIARSAERSSSVWLRWLPASATFFAPLAHADDKVLKAGTMSGPDAQIWSVVTKVAARESLAF